MELDQLDELKAYAIAAWHRFDEEVSDELQRAVAGAFALIACADGELAESEVDSFVKSVIDAETPPKVNAATLEAVFRDLCDALLSDPEDGRTRVLDAIQGVKGDPLRAKLVAHAAQLAASADGSVRASERKALADLYALLGVDPKQLAPASK